MSFVGPGSVPGICCGWNLTLRCAITVVCVKTNGKGDWAVNYTTMYRVIRKSLRDFRTRLRNNQDRHGRKEHINR